MEKPTEETIKEQSQQQLEHDKKYNRYYYHAHNNASICDHCNKTYSSFSALRRHQIRNSKCHLLHERETRAKFQKMLQERFIAHEQEEDGSNKTSRPEQEEELSLKLSQLLRVDLTK